MYKKPNICNDSLMELQWNFNEKTNLESIKKKTRVPSRIPSESI